MRKIIYWSRAVETDADRVRAEQMVGLLESCAKRTDIEIKDWSDLPGDAAFFDKLDNMSFNEMRGGVIVVFDRCRLNDDFRFHPISLYKVGAADVGETDRLEQERVKRGAATALVLRYPTIWPVFVNAGDADEAENFAYELRKKLTALEAVVPKGDALRPGMSPGMLDTFASFAMKQHVLTVAELEEHATRQALPPLFHAPALGAQAAFDPTGLRTIFKAQLLYEMLLLSSRKSDAADGARSRTVTERAISQLVDRLRHPAVVVEEENDIAFLSAYSAYRHGRRVWTVTNFKFFRDGIWRKDIAWAEPEAGGSGLVLRDYDIRFVDLQVAEQKVELRNIADWRCGAKEGDPIDTWIDKAWWRTCSSFDGVETPAKVFRDAHEFNDFDVNARLGIALPKAAGKKKRSPSDYLRAHDISGRAVKLIGVRKPVENVLFFTSSLEDAMLGARANFPARRKLFAFSYRTLLARWRLKEIASGSASHHAPPPVNLEIATSLLDRVRDLRAINHPTAFVYAAVMALESYEILIGKSPSTCMEALHQMYLSETQLEASGVGMSSRVDLTPKAQDISFSLYNLFGNNDAQDFNRERDYASKVWSGVRTVFRGADMFQAANDANIRALTSQRWLGLREWFWKSWRRLTSPFRAVASAVRGKQSSERLAADRPVIDSRKKRVVLRVPGRLPVTEALKKLVASIATDPGAWAKAFVWFWAIASVVKLFADAIAYFLLKKALPTSEDVVTVLREPAHLLVASLTSQFTSLPLDGPMEGFLLTFQIVFLAINMMFMSFFIAMIVRQVTRD